MQPDIKPGDWVRVIEPGFAPLMDQVKAVTAGKVRLAGGLEINPETREATNRPGVSIQIIRNGCA